jgi:hypothetical protein
MYLLESHPQKYGFLVSPKNLRDVIFSTRLRDGHNLRVRYGYTWSLALWLIADV